MVQHGIKKNGVVQCICVYLEENARSKVRHTL